MSSEEVGPEGRDSDKSGAPSFIGTILRKPEGESSFRWRDLRFLARFARPIWSMAAASLVLTLVAAALGSLMPLGTKVLIDFVIPGQSSAPLAEALRRIGLESWLPAVDNALRSINVLVLGMLLLGGAIGVARLAQRYLTQRFEQEMTFNVQTALFNHLLRFPLAFFRGEQTGYLVSRVSDDVDMVHYFFSQTGLQLVTSLFQLVFGITILFSLSVKLALISVLLMPLYMFISYYFAGRQRSVSRAEMERSAQASRKMQEVLSGVEVVKSHATERREARKVSGRLRVLMRARIRSLILGLVSNYAVQGTQFLTTLVIMWFGAAEITAGKMTVGDYVAFTTYVVYLSGGVRNLSLLHLMVQPLFASLDRLMEIFQVVPELPEGREGETLSEVKGEITLENLSFSYDAGKEVLSGISLTAAPGEVVAITGPSGAGKTTLTHLLLKFFEPGRGRVLLDGRDYRELDTRWLRGLVGVVSQEVFLFNDTVEHNIRYGRPGAHREEVERAARQAQIHDVIAALPEGYGTVIGERGLKLSAGQRQRISIARAFLRAPVILILDEPTSALDEATEKLIRQSLEKLIAGRTTFIISHREPIIEVADRVLKLENGSLSKIIR